MVELNNDEYVVTVNVLSDVGCQRTTNEDSVLSVLPGDPDVLDRKGVLVVVADGMGGHSAGEVASRIAVDTIHHAYFSDDGDTPSTLAGAVQRANQAIFAAAEDNAELKGMGTTCTALVLRHGHADCAHVGDSRLYLIRERQIYQMTEDHSAVRSMVARGLLTASEAQHHAERNVLLRAVGTHPTVDVTTWDEPFPLRAGDRFVMCSDGLHDLVSDDEIVSSVVGNPGQAACEALVALARSRGGPDNITVAVINIGAPGEPRGADIRETRTLQVPA